MTAVPNDMIKSKHWSIYGMSKWWEIPINVRVVHQYRMKTVWAAFAICML